MRTRDEDNDVGGREFKLATRFAKFIGGAGS